MTFSLLEERSWHLSSPFSWLMFTLDESHYASLAGQGLAVPGTPEGPEPSSDLTILPTPFLFPELTTPALGTPPLSFKEVSELLPSPHSCC